MSRPSLETIDLGRPKFVWWIAFLQQLPLQIFFTLWASVFFGIGITTIAAGWIFASNKNTPPLSLLAILLSPSAVIFVALFVLIPTVILTAKFMNYRNTRYSISGQHMDIKEGFLTIREKRILLPEIREVSLNRSVLQRLAGLGSVYVATRATGGPRAWSSSALFGGTSMTGSGAMLMDLENYDEIYRRMQDIVNASPSSKAA